MQRRLNPEEPTYHSLKTVQLRGLTSEFYEKLRAIWEGQKDNGKAYITEDALIKSAEYRARLKDAKKTASRERPEENVGGRDTSLGVDRLDDESPQERLRVSPAKDTGAAYASKKEVDAVRSILTAYFAQRDRSFRAIVTDGGLLHRF